MSRTGPVWSAREAIEVFHLLFLRAFSARADRALYALKGSLSAASCMGGLAGAGCRCTRGLPVMNQVEAVQRLKRLGTHGFETLDAAAALDVTAVNAHMILRRLAHAGLLVHVSRGRWLQRANVPPFALPELISAPYPAY